MTIDLETHIRSLAPRAPAGELYKAALEPWEHALLRVAYDMVGGNQVHLAELLGLNRNTVRKKLIAHGLLVPKRRH